MKYRTLGRTGILVSEIAMGCEGFVDKSQEEVTALLDCMETGGVNCIDLYTPDPTMRTMLGNALCGRRDRFVLQAHLCTVWKNGQYARTRDINEVRFSFQDQLNRLGTDHVEIGMIHYVDSLEDWAQVEQGPVLAYARELKEAGVISAIGLSSHNPQAAMAAIATGFIDVLMFSINPCYDLMPASEDLEELRNYENYTAVLVNMDPERQELYETCQRLGIGITVMKAFGGGDLLNAELSPAGVALTVPQCLQYALDRPGVACVMSGARNMDDLQRSIAFAEASAEERDYVSVFTSMPKISWVGHCMYCGHCAPCPVGIDVASVTKFLNLAVAQGEVPETVREHYAVLDQTASACLQCGQCENRCPFAVPVMENMKRAAEVFGK